MNDFENEIYTKIVSRLRESYPNIYVTSEYQSTPSKFPCTSIIQQDISTNENTIDSSGIEKYSDIMFEVNVYTNNESNKKSECKKIMSIIDNVLIGLNFRRTTSYPIPNLYDATIYRMLGRYQATISEKGFIYGR